MRSPTASSRRASTSRGALWRSTLAGVLALLLLAGCSPALGDSPTVEPTPLSATLTPEPASTAPTGSPTATVGPLPTPNLPTATLPSDPGSTEGHYENADLGFALDYPPSWSTQPGETEATLVWLFEPRRRVVAVAFYSSMPPDATLEQAAQQVRDATTSGVGGVEQLGDRPLTLADGRPAWVSEYTGELQDGSAVRVTVASSARAGQLFTLLAFGAPDGFEQERAAVDSIITSMTLTAPRVAGVPREQALILLGGESNNPRDYDPANGGGDDLVFSGLVTFNPQLEIVPDLAESWDVSSDGTVYTFHLRPEARFHDGRPLTAQDVIFSWERAADPATDSDTVLTYLGDIVGVRDRHTGAAESIAGLQAIDDHTLQVTIDAPKPYFLMKLTYSTAYVVDRANVESGPEWYRTPNGAGPYRLIRWEPLELQIYERNDAFYLDPPAIRFIVVRLFAGVGIRMYETGDIDVTGVGLYDVERVRDATEPLNRDLREGVSMCTSYIVFDVTQPPFDDPKVRQAFALAVDKQRYIDVVLRGVAIPARGLYPPALPGHNLDLRGLDFDPELARQRLAESRYGDAASLPPIVFTNGGFGSDVGGSVAALAAMWQANLGVTIQIENLEPSKYFDELHDGHHGQVFSYGWCADYPDPENFADALFHSGAQQNLGNYANPEVDALLEQARVERDVTKRIQMYQQAEQIIVEDAAGIFLSHSLSFLLVKPYIQGYVLTPIAVPVERYISIDTAAIEQ